MRWLVATGRVNIACNPSRGEVQIFSRNPESIRHGTVEKCCAGLTTMCVTERIPIAYISHAVCTLLSYSMFSISIRHCALMDSCH